MPRNGLERWRGEVSAHLENIPKLITALGEQFSAALKTHVDDDTTTFKDHNERISKLEHAQDRLLGKMAVVAVLVGAFVAAIAEAAMRRLIDVP
jgi:hypothetical protein